MRKLIISLCLFATASLAQYVPVQYNTNTGVFAFGGTNSVTTNMQFQAANINVLTSGYVVHTNFICEADFKDYATQTFSAGVTKVITNFAVNVCHPIFTATHSNATVAASGWYRAYMKVNYDAGGASDVECYLYTNNALAITASGNRIGWDNETTAVGQIATAAFEKMLYISAGTIVDWRITCVANETLEWKHGTVGLEIK